MRTLATFPDGILPMANDAHIVAEDHLFAAGDVRANENVELISLQTMFVREHNYWATRIAAANHHLSDEQIYQQARSRVIAASSPSPTTRSQRRMCSGRWNLASTSCSTRSRNI